MSDYWLGVLTIPALLGVGYALVLILGFLVTVFDRSPWFVEFGKSPEPFERSYASLRVERRGLFLIGHYDQSNWGSHWVALGPICVGRKYRTA